VTDKGMGGAKSQAPAKGPERMPDFDLKDPAGHEFTSAQFRGKVLLLDFWGTWCAPCKQEIPGYERLYRRYKDRGFVVIGIAADSDPALVAEFAKKLKITYPLLINGMDVQKYGVEGLPETMLIDRNGVIRKKVVGFEYTEAFESALLELL
jgi:peroxiredoxin